MHHIHFNFQLESRNGLGLPNFLVELDASHRNFWMSHSNTPSFGTPGQWRKQSPQTNLFWSRFPGSLWTGANVTHLPVFKSPSMLFPYDSRVESNNDRLLGFLNWWLTFPGSTETFVGNLMRDGLLFQQETLIGLAPQLHTHQQAKPCFKLLTVWWICHANRSAKLQAMQMAKKNLPKQRTEDGDFSRWVL
jgi:hypothetical protein